MGLIDRINQLLRGTPSVAQPQTTTQEMPTPVSPANLGQRFSAARDRAAIVKECRRMYDTDTRVKGIIQSVSRDAVKGGFVVKVKGNPAAEQIANDAVKRLQLRKRLDDWCRLTFRDGDSFLELGVDEQGEIALITRKPTLDMHRNTDSNDLFGDPLRAYWWSNDTFSGFSDQPPDGAVWFAHWQILHARWEHDEGNRYGRPMFAAAGKSFKRMDEGELDMAVRRKTRAGMKFVHVVEGADETQLEAYKSRNQDALDDPFAAVTDFFTNRPGGITGIQGDANLNQYDDVMHHVRTFWLASPIAMSLLGYGQDLNRDVLQEQKEQYDEAIEQITEWVESEMVTPILHLQWLLQGIYPESLDYEIAWKSRHEPSAQDIGTAADAAIKLKALGLDETTVLSIIAPFIPNVDVMAAAQLTGVGSAREAGAQGIAAAASPAEEAIDRIADWMEARPLHAERVEDSPLQAVQEDKMPDIHIHLPESFNVLAEAKPAPAPQITVNVPQQPAPVVNVPRQAAPVVNVSAPVVNVPAPVVNVTVPAPVVTVDAPTVNVQPAAVEVRPQITVDVPAGPRRTRETQQVVRDRDGNIEGTVTEITYD